MAYRDDVVALEARVAALSAGAGTSPELAR